jgi:hypothetical protein
VGKQVDGTYGVKLRIGFWWENIKEIDYLKNLHVDGRIILKLIFKNGMGVDWIDMAQERDMWRSVVSAVKDF